MSTIVTFEPEVSIASPPIFLKKVFLIKPLEKSESMPSDKVFFIKVFFILKLDLIIFNASSDLLSIIVVLKISIFDR